MQQKKDWIQERQKLRAQINSFKRNSDMLEHKVKYLQDTINRNGNFDKQEFEFEMDSSPGTGRKSNGEEVKGEDVRKFEIQQEQFFNKKAPPTKEDI